MWQGRLEPALCQMEEFLIEADAEMVRQELEQRIAALVDAQEAYNRRLNDAAQDETPLEWEFSYRIAPLVNSLEEVAEHFLTVDPLR